MSTSLKTEQTALEAAASKLLSLALKAGAEKAEVCASYSQRTRLSLEKQDYHLASSDDGHQLGIRVLIGSKQGFASSNSIEGNELKNLAQKAVQIAKLSPENPYYTIPAAENLHSECPGEAWDDSIHSLSLQTQKEMTQLMANEATKDAKFRLNEGSFGVSSGLSLVMNSLGTIKTEKENMANWSLMGMGVDGTQITSFDYFQKMARSTDKISDKIAQTTRSFVDSVLWNLKQGKSQSYKGIAIFSPRALFEVLIEPLTYHLNGRVLVEGTGRWKIGDMGKRVLESELTIHDDPWLSDRFGFVRFDREGTPTRRMALLEQGTIKNFMLDGYAAKALGKTTTGHASGGPSATPSVGSHTLRVSAGKTKLSDLQKQATERQKEFLLVHRFSGQTNPVTGDFSGVAKGGEWWHAGERVYGVKETLISGNIFEILGKSLVGVSAETEIIDCAEEGPYIVADQVSVTGS